MPTYDYHCDACHHDWELFQKITADPETKCPACGKKKARRLFGTGAAIVFKGSGFYETDYRSDSYKKGADAAKEKSDSKDSKDSKSDGAGPDKTTPPAKSDAQTGNKETKPTAPRKKPDDQG